MRESWVTGRFWFDFAARDAPAADGVYWAMLREVDVDFAMPAKKEAEMERYVEYTRRLMPKTEQAKKE
jgi:hypothetical protein